MGKYRRFAYRLQHFGTNAAQTLIMKTKLSRLAFALCAAILLVPATTTQCAVFSDEATLIQAAVFAQDPMFDSIGQISVYDSAGRSRGSGTIIGNGSWVLTAGHMITYSINNGYAINQVEFSLGSNTNAPTATVSVDSWYVYPGFTGSGAGQQVDLALVHLSTPITVVTPVSLYTASQSSLSGMTSYMCGFGRPGTAGNGVNTFDGLRRAGANIIGDASYPYWLESQYLISRFDPPNSSSAVALEWESSPGDSGGGWLVDVGGTLQLAGVNSGRNDDPTYSFGDISFAVNVSSYLDWIYGVIGALPSLSIQQIGGNEVELQWPAWATSYMLQSCTDLAGSNWVAVAAGVVNDGTNRSVTVSVSGGDQQFWRLARQAALVPQKASVPGFDTPPSGTGFNLIVKGSVPDRSYIGLERSGGGNMLNALATIRKGVSH